MAFQFPSNPIIGQIFVAAAGVEYRWNGVAWFLTGFVYLTQDQGDARYVRLSTRGVANGVATLDAGTKVPIAQLPAGTANGVASLDGTGKVPVAQLPTIASVPTGTVIDFAGSSAPSDYLPCDGAAVSRTTYAALFAVLGGTWGAGNGSTTFNVPDLRRRVTMGSGGTSVSGPANTLGSVGGEEVHQLTIAEMPAHVHTMGRVAGGTGALQFSSAAGMADISPSTGSQGSSAAHTNVQPSAVVQKIIKT